MSQWYEPEGDDIDIKHDSQEVNIWVTDSGWGNVYLTLTFDQVRELCKKIETVAEEVV